MLLNKIKEVINKIAMIDINARYIRGDISKLERKLIELDKKIDIINGKITMLNDVKGNANKDNNVCKDNKTKVYEIDLSDLKKFLHY